MTDTYRKTPAGDLPFHVNWASEDGTNDGGADDTGWLQGRTIATSTWALPSGPDGGTESKTGTVATIMVSGGTLNQDYTLVNRVVTSDSPALTDERSIIIQIRER